MSLKFVVFAACLAATNAGLIGAPLTYAPGAPVAYSAAYPAIAKVAAPIALAKTVVSEEYDPNPQYSFGYSIDDALTGDSKNQQESRSGDVVQGSYSLTDPDGTRRTVEYTADPINGFNAVVHKEPLVAKAIVAAPAPVAYHAAPAFAKVAAAPLPYGYSAPFAYAKYH